MVCEISEIKTSQKNDVEKFIETINKLNDKLNLLEEVITNLSFQIDQLKLENQK